MPVPFLSDIELRNNKILDATLSGTKFDTAPANPQPGHVYKDVNGVLVYRNTTNVELPVHENAITQIASTGALTATTAGRTTTLTLANASATVPGTMSAAHFALIDGSTAANTPNTIVRRNANGDFTAGIISVTDLVGLSATPATASSATSRSYVDTQVAQTLSSAVNNLDRKESVRVGLTANQALNVGAGVFDGVTLAAGDRLLLLGQTNRGLNGTYVVGATALTRAPDSNSPANLTAGATYYVEQGTLAQNFFTLITLTNASGFTLNTTELNFVNASANTILGGDGLERDGQILHVRGTANQISVTANAVAISSNYAGQPSITQVGTIASGVWNGTAIAIANGGTGATNAATALINLGATRKFATTIGDGTATSIAVTHNLNSLDCQVSVRDTAIPGFVVHPDIRIDSANACTIMFSTAPAANAYRVIILG